PASASALRPPLALCPSPAVLHPPPAFRGVGRRAVRGPTAGESGTTCDNTPAAQSATLDHTGGAAAQPAAAGDTTHTTAAQCAAGGTACDRNTP
ncbi:MAG: hypothetical protein BJ554DRAFT_7816, partial [Olpidium bornovanus]